MSDAENKLWEKHATQIRDSQPRFEELISQVTGWQGVSDLARWCVELLVANQGGSGMDDVRPPCFQDHAPATVSQFTEALVTVSGRPADDPVVQQEVEKYRQKLRDRFGL